MMNTLLANRCCCNTCVTNHNAFKLSFRYRSAYQQIKDNDRRVQALASDGPFGHCTGTVPALSCGDPSHDCSVPALGSSSASYSLYTPSVLCAGGGYKADYTSNFDMNIVDLVIPYFNTTTETAVQGGSGVPCSWVYNFNGTLTESGLGYYSERLVDNNRLNWTYDKTFSGCQTSCVVQNGSTNSATINISYGHRAKYTEGPVYMYVARPAQHPEFNNWTWEITGGVFIVRNAGGFVQNSYDLHGKTLQQAAVAIDAFASVVVYYTSGIPAGSFPATLMEDKPRTTLKLVGGGSPSSDPIFLLNLVGNEVEVYQSGTNSPFWRIGYETTTAASSTTYYCNAGCLNSTSEYSYTEGIDVAAEQLFCKGIATRRIPSVPNATNAPEPGTGKINSGDTFGISPLVNYPEYDIDPQLDYACNPSLVRNCTALYDFNGGTWNFLIGSFPSFGNRATAVSYPGHYLSSDDVGATTCSFSHGVDCDFCDCDPYGCYGCVCYKQFDKYAWNTYEFCKVVRV